MTNSMKLQFESRSCNESFARTAVAAFAAQLDPTYEELSDIKTAVSEAVTNCIVHAYAERLDSVYITAQIKEGNTFLVKIRDRGCGIADIAKAMEPLYTTSPEGERAGLGFAVMQSLCDKVTVRSKPGQGTTVTLLKKFKAKQ
ncbi:MAG: anti-sigma F factor [Provencibacterium sp.]|jgi:stage II sporulation protein AB (anti-sigma F factor)|nr:anti-sigma F factor [Provencibacterium sp.]